MRREWFALCLALFAAAVVPVGVGTASSTRPGPGLWSNGANVITGRERHTATLLRDGRVLVVGGTDGRNIPLASAEIYDPRTNRWTRAGSMATARIGHAVTLLSSGMVLVTGGFGAPVPSSTLATTELYDPSSNSWPSAAPMIGTRVYHTATLLRDGRVLVVGGSSFTIHDNGLFPNQPADAEIYDPEANRWSVTSAMSFYRIGHSATLLADGRVLIAGGQDALTATEIFDGRSGRWVEGASTGVGRFGHTATLLANGDVLVAGGDGIDQMPMTDGERYDVRLNRWSPTASMAAGRFGHTATLLRDGAVLVVGGIDFLRPERYDPVSNKWSATGPRAMRYNHTATRLADERVLVVGGYGLESLASVLLYDPNGVAPVPSRPLDPLVVAALLLIGGLIIAAAAWSIPPVRRRLRRLRPADGEDCGSPERRVRVTVSLKTTPSPDSHAIAHDLSYSGRPMQEMRGCLQTRPRRVIRALLAVSLLTLMLSTSVADTLYSQIQGKSQQLNGVNGAITATKTHVQQLLDQEAALQRQIAGLDASLAQVAQQIRQETAALVALAAQVEQAKRDLAVKEAQLKKHILDFGLRVRAMYKTGEVNPLELILSAQSFTDLLNRTVFFAAVIRESRVEVVKLQQERAAVEAMKADLDAKYAQQAAIVKQIKDQQAQLQAQRAMRAQAEAQVAAIVAEFQQQLAQMEAQRATLKNQLQALIAESARAGSTGHFIWPMQGAITQGFGCTSYPFEPYDPGCPGGHFHSGIDIATDAGTPIHASDAGIVHNYTMACGGYLCGYGQYVLVVHAAGFVTLYGHLSGYGQADGAIVGQGTVIGYEGSTGNSTGPHLHFEIDLNGTPVNPFAYLP